MRGWLRLVALAAVVTVLVPAAAGAQARGGVMRIGMDADNTTMDPHRSTGAVDRQVYNNVYGKLVDTDSKFNIVPQLALSWDIKDGGKTYVFKLRRGVKFHDGSDFNAESVKWNFERMRDPALAAAQRDRAGGCDFTRCRGWRRRAKRSPASCSRACHSAGA